MARAMSDTPKIDFVPGHGGARIAVHSLGTGRPVVLLHGLASSATINWIRYGHAERIARAGRRVVMLDMRAHGKSDAPTNPAAWPHDVLALDIEAVLAELGLVDFDLVGYSLGSRLSIMLVARGARPGQLVLGGMGLEGLTGWAKRRDWFLSALARWDVAKLGDPDYLAIQFMKTVKADPEALRLLLGTMGDLPAETLRAIAMPTLVLSGVDDRDNGSAQALAAALPDARIETVPGNHMSCITKSDFGAAIAAFLEA